MGPTSLFAYGYAWLGVQSGRRLSCIALKIVSETEGSFKMVYHSDARSYKATCYFHLAFFPTAVTLLMSVVLVFGQKPISFQNIQIGALDANAWNGVVFLTQAYGQRADFALRIGSQSGSHFLDGGGIFDAVGEVGPHAPDGSYCRIGWRNLPRQAMVTLEWSKINQSTVVGRLTAESGFRLVVETYFPGQQGWGAQGYYHVEEGNRAIVGQRFFGNEFGKSSCFLVTTDQSLLGSGVYPSLTQLREIMRGSGKLTSSLSSQPTEGAAGMEFEAVSSDPLHFVAEVGWNEKSLVADSHCLLEPGKIDSILRQKELDYAARRPSVAGLFGGAAAAIGNSMFWNTVYAPSTNLIFPSISRHWAHGWGGWVVGEWDCFFGSLLTSLEEKAQTEAGVKAIVLAQTDTGLIPNIASGNGSTPDRSQPPVGSYCVLKEYERFRDRQMLEWGYPRLKRWHEWWFANRGDGQPWRDGNRDGLLEWGSDRGSSVSMGGRGFLQAAKWESGMDDSPMYDHAVYDPRTYTMNLDDVGLNSLYALDSECMAKIATILGKKADAAQFTRDYVQVKELVRQRLWNERDGIYENRYWNGRFSRRLSPTNFYPLVAGIATQSQAERMIRDHLLSPKEFWGKYVMPTIARNDPAFADQFYWRGAIWGPTNYLVYEGLNRYQFDQVALQFAEKNYNLYMGDWRRNQHDDEQYHEWGGNGGGDTHYTWGALLCLMGIEQYIDENPWDGLRFGALNPLTTGEIHNVRWGNHLYDVAIGPARTQLTRDRTLRFKAEAGVVVRNYKVGDGSLSFGVDTERPVRVTTMEFNSGVLGVRMDGKTVGQVSIHNQSTTVKIPAGRHVVEFLKMSLH